MILHLARDSWAAAASSSRESRSPRMVTVTVPVYNEENKVYQVLSFLGNNEVHNVKPKTLIDFAYD